MVVTGKKPVECVVDGQTEERGAEHGRQDMDGFMEQGEAAEASGGGRQQG